MYDRATRSSVVTALGLVVPLMLACTTTRVDRQRIASVNKIAIIGFQGIYDVEDPGESDKGSITQVANAAADVARDASGEEDRELRKALDASYDRLVEVVATETKIPVLSRRDLSRNTWYRTRKQELGRAPGFDLSTADGVIGFSQLVRVTPDERQQYMEQLGVDAVALARVFWLTGDTREAGWAGLAPGGKRIRPLAQVEFTIWHAGSSEPIWDEDGIRGCPAREGLEDLGGLTVWTDMGPVLREATENGYRALIDRYRQAQASENGAVGLSMDTLTGTVRCD